MTPDSSRLRSANRFVSVCNNATSFGVEDKNPEAQPLFDGYSMVEIKHSGPSLIPYADRGEFPYDITMLTDGRGNRYFEDVFGIVVFRVKVGEHAFRHPGQECLSASRWDSERLNRDYLSHRRKVLDLGKLFHIVAQLWASHKRASPNFVLMNPFPSRASASNSRGPRPKRLIIQRKRFVALLTTGDSDQIFWSGRWKEALRRDVILRHGHTSSATKITFAHSMHSIPKANRTCNS